MTLSSDAWPTVQRAIREMIVMPLDEPADMILTAAFLFNHAKSRNSNVWLVLVAPEGEGKTALVDLFASHPVVHKMPDRPSGAYFLNSSGSALFDMDAAGQHILLQADMDSLTHAVVTGSRKDIYSQWKAVHDGYYRCVAANLRERLKFKRTVLTWGPKAPSESVGLLGAGTERVYGWVDHSLGLGSRFLLYYMDPRRSRHWTDTADLEMLCDRLAQKTEYRESARSSLFSYLDMAMADLHEYDNVRFHQVLRRQVLAGLNLAVEIAGVARKSTFGKRRAIELVEMTRMFAFMRGRSEVDKSDVEIGVRLALSQIDPLVQEIFSFAMQSERRGQWFRESELAIQTRRVKATATVVRDLVEGGIFKIYRGRGQRGYVYRFTKEALKMADIMDPDRTIFTPPPEPIEPINDFEFDQLVAESEG